MSGEQLAGPTHVSRAMSNALTGRTVLRAGCFVLAAYVWYVSYERWAVLVRIAYGNLALGYDLKFSWLAATAFSHGQGPFSVPGFVYPPSHVLLVWPIAAVPFATLRHDMLYVTVACFWATAVVGAAAVGRRPWGLLAALGAFALRYVWPVGDEIVLENITALIAVLLALMLLLSARGKWKLGALVLGLSLALKPMLLPVLVVYLLARRWRELAIALGLPLGLNAIAFLVVPKIGEFWAVLPFVLDRTGASYDAYNSAIGSVVSLAGLGGAVGIVLRVVALVFTALATWWSWTRLSDATTRLVVTTGVLLVGFYLFGSLTEDHYMLTLVPLGLSIGAPGSPIRIPSAWLGFSWLMGYHVLSATTLGMDGLDALTTSRCIGLGIVLLTILAGARLQGRPMRLRAWFGRLHGRPRDRLRSSGAERALSGASAP